MSESETSIRVERDGAIQFITLARPASLNAIDIPMAEAFSAALRQAEHDPDVRAVVIRGAGKHFMAGGDVQWFASTLDDALLERQRAFEHLITAVHDCIIRIRTMPKPVLASVRGAAAGFGFSLFCACDLAVCSQNCTFTLAYSQLGATPDGGSPFLLPRILGSRRAMEIALLSDRFDAARAHELGLANRVVADEALETEALALARKLADSATAALGATKRLINESFDHSLPEQLLAEQKTFAHTVASDDFAEGVRAFLGKRPAKFRGH